MFRKKQFKKRRQYHNDRYKPKYYKNGENNHNNSDSKNVHNKMHSLSHTKRSKLERLSQLDKEISEIVFDPEYRNSGRYDELLLERWQLRFLLNL